MLERNDMLLEVLQLTSIVIAQVGQRFLFLLLDQILEGVYGIRYINWIIELEREFNQKVARFNRDATSQTSLHHRILLEGIEIITGSIDGVVSCKTY